MKNVILSASFALFFIGLFPQTNSGTIYSPGVYQEKFSSANLEKVEENSNWEGELANGTELEFDEEGNFRKLN